jgi:16S rRNA G527 N7-methylase RsmG
MGLINVHVDSARRDAATFQPTFDLVTGRAFAEPRIFLDTAAHALRPGGHAMLFAGPTQREAIRGASASAFDELKLIPYEVPRGSATVAHLLAVARRKA